MARSQNGWTVVDKDDCDQGPFEGVRFPNGIRRGDVATIARWQLGLYVRTVEPLRAGTCWGWYDKTITGSQVRSNHASGTAWDINATQHPMGPPTSTNMSAREIAACRAIVRASEGTLRWGGDFSRDDPMHWEIDCSPAEAAVFARKIRDGDDMTQDEMLDALESPRGRAALRNALVELAYGPADNRESIAGRIGNIDSKIDAVTVGVARLVEAIEDQPAQFEIDRPHGSDEPAQESPV